jgi:hypothetical protein
MRFPRFNTKSVFLCCVTFAAAVASAGCGGTPFDDPAHVAAWANAASAVGVYVHAYEPLAFADGEVAFIDPACPIAADDGETATITGGCTDKDGVAWLGSATVVRTGDDRSLSFDGYGKSSEAGGESTLKGTVTVRLTGADAHAFVIDLVQTGGAELVIDYTGTVEGGYGGRSVWSGSGTVTRGGAFEPTGTVEATTTDETLDDDVCSGQAASGETSLRIGEDEAIVTYDGATDCDEDQAAKWSLNGEPQGLVTGVVCSTAAPGAGARKEPLGALFLLMAFGAARRARHARQTRAAMNLHRSRPPSVTAKDGKR